MGSLKPNQTVVLNSLPPGLFTGLPRSDQNALRAVVGRAVTFVDYTSYDQAEITFVDSEGDGHTFYVDPTCLTTWEGHVVASFDRMDKELGLWRTEVFQRLDRLQATLDEWHAEMLARNNREGERV